MIVLVKISI